MGAYDNPKLIQPVNVGEIWARSSANVLDAFNSYLQDDAKKKAAAKKLISESEERIANFGEKVETAKEGSLFASVQGTSEEMTKAYADLEMKKLKGELSSKDYAVGTQGLFSKVNELRNFNANFDEFEKLFQETENISAYQEEGAATLAALDAKKKGKFNLRIENGQWIAQFEDPMGNTRDFNPNNLNEAKNLMINEKLDAGADVQAGSDLINKLKTKTGNSYTYKDDSGSYSEKQVEQWADPRFLNEDGSTNTEELVKYLKTNTASPIADINMMEAGSYIVDSKLRAGVTLAKDGEIQDPIFKSELDKSGYPQEVKDEIIKAAELGGYRRYVHVNGEKIDTSGFAIAYAKEAMARDAVAQAGDLAQKSVSRTVDKTTDAEDKPDQYTRSVGQARADARSIIDALLRDRGSFIREVYGVVPETPDAKDVVGDEDLIKVPTGEEGEFQTYDFNRKEDILNLANSIATERYRPGKLTGIFQDEMKSYLLKRRRERLAKNLN